MLDNTQRPSQVVLLWHFLGCLTSLTFSPPSAIPFALAKTTVCNIAHPRYIWNAYMACSTILAKILDNLDKANSPLCSSLCNLIRELCKTNTFESPQSLLKKVKKNQEILCKICLNTSRKLTIVIMLKLLLTSLAEVTKGKINQKLIPSSKYAYMLSRIMQWLALVATLADSRITRDNPLDTLVRDYLD